MPFAAKYSIVYFAANGVFPLFGAAIPYIYKEAEIYIRKQKGVRMAMWLYGTHPK